MASDQDDAELTQLENLTVPDLTRYLKAAGIPCDISALKPELQVLCALHKLRYLDGATRPDQTYLKIIIEWLGLPTIELVRVVESRGLTAKSNKAKRMQALIEDL